jgi:hypothetical protein
MIKMDRTNNIMEHVATTPAMDPAAFLTTLGHATHCSL